MGRKRDVIGLNAHNGETCFTVHYSKFNMFILSCYISIIPLRRNFYPLRKYLLWRSIEISFAAYVVCRSLISSLRRKIYLSKTISLPSLRYYQGLTPKRTVASLLSCYAGKLIFFPHQVLPYEKSSYVRTSFSIRFNFREQLKFSHYYLCGKGYNRPNPHYIITPSRCRRACIERDTERIGASKRQKLFEQTKVGIALVCGEAGNDASGGIIACGFGRNSRRLV